ncbi:hypothetical protein LXL04_024862 [Taraxacum kok-saghyz]
MTIPLLMQPETPSIGLHNNQLCSIETCLDDLNAISVYVQLPRRGEDVKLLLLVKLREVLCLHYHSDGQPLLASRGSSGVISRPGNSCIRVTYTDANDSSADNSIKMWIFDTTDGDSRLLKFRSDHSAPHLCIRFYANGRHVLSTDQDRAFRLFSIIQDQQSRELSQRHITKRAKKLKLKSIIILQASYLKKREELEATGEYVDDDSIFYEVVGGHDRKRRLYGFESFGKVIQSKKSSNDMYYTPETNASKELAEKNAELAQVKELVIAQKEQNEELKELVNMQADQLKTQNEQSKQLQN